VRDAIGKHFQFSDRLTQARRSFRHVTPQVRRQWRLIFHFWAAASGALPAFFRTDMSRTLLLDYFASAGR
jgi:hypothetical protein